jgi:hypothetical protein
MDKKAIFSLSRRPLQSQRLLSPRPSGFTSPTMSCAISSLLSTRPRFLSLHRGIKSSPEKTQCELCLGGFLLLSISRAVRVRLEQCPFDEIWGMCKTCLNTIWETKHKHFHKTMTSIKHGLSALQEFVLRGTGFMSDTCYLFVIPIFLTTVATVPNELGWFDRRKKPHFYKTNMNILLNVYVGFYKTPFSSFVISGLYQIIQ